MRSVASDKAPATFLIENQRQNSGMHQGSKASANNVSLLSSVAIAPVTGGAELVNMSSGYKFEDLHSPYPNFGSE